MKNLKYILLVAIVSMFHMTMKADNDRIITIQQLPAKSRAILHNNYQGRTPVRITVDYDDYTVYFPNGEKIEFDLNGEILDIDYGRVAVSYVGMVPQPISQEVSRMFPGASIIKIEHEGYGYEVKLSTGHELKFDHGYRLFDIDD